MSFKIVFLLVVSYGKYSAFIRLKREYFMKFVPTAGLNVKIDQKIHLIENVVYDLSTDIFNVTLEEDESSRYTYRIINLDKLVDMYIKDGWEESISMAYKIIKTTPEMHEIIEATNDIKDQLDFDAFTEMVASMMLKSKLTKTLELAEIFYFCNLETCQSIRIMEKIKNVLMKKPK